MTVNGDTVRFKRGQKCSFAQLNSFLKFHNLATIDDLPRCNCGAQVYFNVKEYFIGKTCGKNSCLHDKLSKSYSDRNRARIERGEWQNPISSLSEEQRKAISKKAVATLKSRLTPEELSERMRKISLSQTPEKRSEVASKSNKTRWKIGNHNFQMTAEARSARARKAAITKMLRDHSNVSKIETECFEFLKSELSEDYAIQQYQIKGLDHVYDMYFPRNNLIVEFDGDFWHKDRKEQDSRLSEIALDNNYLMFRVPEWRYRQNKSLILSEIKEYLNGEC